MKGFIFDLDGTLLDSLGLWLKIDQDYMRQHGIAYKQKYSDDIKKLTFQECAYYFKNVLKIDRDVEKIQKDWREMSYRAYRDELLLKPYAYEFVSKCAKKGKCIVATSCQKDSALAALQRCGILKFMEDVITTNEIGCNKENPMIYQQCASVLQAMPNECCVFEDVLSAALCAKSAGFQVVGVYDKMWQKDMDEMKKICHQYILSFEELL